MLFKFKPFYKKQTHIHSHLTHWHAHDKHTTKTPHTCVHASTHRPSSTIQNTARERVALLLSRDGDAHKFASCARLLRFQTANTKTKDRTTTLRVCSPTRRHITHFIAWSFVGLWSVGIRHTSPSRATRHKPRARIESSEKIIKINCVRARSHESIYISIYLHVSVNVLCIYKYMYIDMSANWYTKRYIKFAGLIYITRALFCVWLVPAAKLP